jgi:hypothetical protein
VLLTVEVGRQVGGVLAEDVVAQQLRQAAAAGDHLLQPPLVSVKSRLLKYNEPNVK